MQSRLCEFVIIYVCFIVLDGEIPFYPSYNYSILAKESPDVGRTNKENPFSVVLITYTIMQTYFIQKEQLYEGGRGRGSQAVDHVDV